MNTVREKREEYRTAQQYREGKKGEEQGSKSDRRRGLTLRG